MTHDEWVAEATKRFGESPLGWTFRCPNCGHRASVADFEAVLTGSGARATAECIGRVMAETGAGPSFDALRALSFSAGTPAGGPCDWAAFGLLSRPDTVTVVRDGREINAFPFAEAA